MSDNWRMDRQKKVSECDGENTRFLLSNDR